MDIRQLRYFIAIAEERTISAAARRLHIAQPPLSQQLKLMEDQLGVCLVERTNKRLSLTEAGQTLYKHALKIAKYMEESETEVKEAGSGLKGKLTLGINTLSHPELPGLLQAFRSRYPKVTYKIQQNESALLCKLVKERIVDLAIIRLPLDLNDFSVLHFRTEPFYFVTPGKQEPVRRTVTFEFIAEHPLAIPSSEGLGVYHLVWEAFSSRNLKPDFICECSDIAMMMELVASGFASAIVPENVLKLHRRDNVQAYEIEDSTLLSSSALIWLKDHYVSKTAQNFIDFLTVSSPSAGG
ncbi:LysR family transcriptional regulator [Paenibacillus sp. MBLB4367]|uniref:LysR family transcriptional regulator n=1 Tax=Paenibacillus sp. MBLB4367 TaxID=3384767 RepID=UPI003907FCD4